jgi:uroporphyrinogen-III synthase
LEQPAPELPEPTPNSAPAKRRRVLLIAALLIVVLVLAIGSVLWIGQSESTGTAAATTPESVISPAPKAVPDTELTQRVDQLEATVTKLADQAASKSDVAALRQQIIGLSQKLDTLSQRPESDPQALAALSDDLKHVAGRFSTLEARLDRKETDQRNERGLVLAAAQITAALNGSGPYEAPVAILQAIASNDHDLAEPLAILARHAKSGVESRIALSEELAALPAKLSAPTAPPPDAGFWARTWQRLTGLIQVRRVEDGTAPPSASPGPDALIARAGVELRGGDLSAAVQSMRLLDGHDGEVAAPWLEAATARLEAEQAAEALQATATERLNVSGGSQP